MTTKKGLKCVEKDPRYVVRAYVDEDEICRYEYFKPRGTSNQDIILHGMGILFLHQISSDTQFCVYADDDRNFPLEEQDISNYGDHDCLWDDESLANRVIEKNGWGTGEVNSLLFSFIRARGEFKDLYLFLKTK